MRELLESVRQGALSIDETLERLRHLPYESIGFAEVDHHRALRQGFPEVVLGEGKSRDQIVSIAERLAAQTDQLLLTRVDVETYRAVKERLPDARYHADVVEAVHLAAHHLRGNGRFLRHRQVRRARAENGHPRPAR